MEHRMICLDNSEWMRNGDYRPTRIKAQRDAANILCTRHLSANPENTIGIMTLAGPRCTIHCTQCKDSQRLHRAISLDNTPVGGKCRFVNGIKIARLALKNRPNQRGEARIILFVGSPVQGEVKDFKRLGGQLKKNSCAISVILLGEIGDNKEKMETLVNAARKEEGQQCDLILVPAGVRPLEVIRQSPLCVTNYGGSGTTGSAGATTTPAGGAENELERALRLSLLDAQGGAGAADATTVPPEAMTEEEQIRRAIELSIAATGGDSGTAAGDADNAAGTENAGDGDEGEEEEEEADEDDEAAMIAQALAMSQAAEAEDDEDADELEAALKASLEGQDDESVPAIPEASGDAGFSDPDYVKNLLAGIQGVSADDPLIQAAFAEAQKIQSEKEKEGDAESGDKGGKKEDEE